MSVSLVVEVKRKQEKAGNKTQKVNVTGTFFRNVAAVSLFVAVILFTPSGDWTRIIYGKSTKTVTVPSKVLVL